MSDAHGSTHRWAIGVDPSDGSHGAERFGTWLHERSGGREHARTVSDDEVELGRIAEDENLDGLVVERHAPTDGWTLVSLGRVARALLRELPCPVVVVPPDVDPSSFGNGPVLVCVEPDDASVAAADFGRELGRRLGLPTVLVHAVPDPQFVPIPAASPEVVMFPPRIDLDTLRTTAATTLRDWAERHGFDDLSLATRVGRCRWELLAEARKHGACVIVCGSRQLSPIQRLFRSSTGAELAAHAARPVAVVPAAA